MQTTTIAQSNDLNPVSNSNRPRSFSFPQNRPGLRSVNGNTLDQQNSQIVNPTIVLPAAPARVADVSSDDEKIPNSPVTQTNNPLNFGYRRMRGGLGINTTSGTAEADLSGLYRHNDNHTTNYLASANVDPFIGSIGGQVGSTDTISSQTGSETSQLNFKATVSKNNSLKAKISSSDEKKSVEGDSTKNELNVETSINKSQGLGTDVSTSNRQSSATGSTTNTSSVGANIDNNGNFSGNVSRSVRVITNDSTSYIKFQGRLSKQELEIILLGNALSHKENKTMEESRIVTMYRTIVNRTNLSIKTTYNRETGRANIGWEVNWGDPCSENESIVSPRQIRNTNLPRPIVSQSIGDSTNTSSQSTQSTFNINDGTQGIGVMSSNINDNNNNNNFTDSPSFGSLYLNVLANSERLLNYNPPRLTISRPEFVPFDTSNGRQSLFSLLRARSPLSAPVLAPISTPVQTHSSRSLGDNNSVNELEEVKERVNTLTQANERLTKGLAELNQASAQLRDLNLRNRELMQQINEAREEQLLLMEGNSQQMNTGNMQEATEQSTRSTGSWLNHEGWIGALFIALMLGGFAAIDKYLNKK